MQDIPLEQRFSVLTSIARAQHFAWREAVRQACPEVDAGAVVDRMWVETGHETARAYLKKIDPGQPLAAQVAASIAWSSQCMGEDATAAAQAAEPGPSPAAGAADRAYVRHRDCPWFHWHRRLGLLAEDRRGCDLWFRTLVGDIATATGKRLRVETLETLPDGHASCLRRLWVDDGA